MAVVSLGQSAFTRLARSYASGNLVAFGSLLGKLLAFGQCWSVRNDYFQLAGREILTILFRPEYAERADLLPWIMATGSVLFMAQFLGFGMTAAGYYNSQVVPEYSCEPKPFSSLLLVGCTAGAARGVPRDADRCDRAACRERRDSSHRPANTRPCVCRKG